MDSNIENSDLVNKNSKTNLVVACLNKANEQVMKKIQKNIANYSFPLIEKKRLKGNLI